MLLCGQLFIENFRIKHSSAECSGCENDGCADQNGSFFRSTVRILCRFSGGAPICGTSTY